MNKQTIKHLREKFCRIVLESRNNVGVNMEESWINEKLSQRDSSLDELIVKRENIDLERGRGRRWMKRKKDW